MYAQGITLYGPRQSHCQITSYNTLIIIFAFYSHRHDKRYSEILLVYSQNVTKLRTWASQFLNAVELGYNDIGLYDTSSIASEILWYQLIPHC
jgi:hypothetical protein